MTHTMHLYGKSYAKVNLGLHVGALREDGFHEIETLFLPVYGLYDDMHFALLQGASPHIRLFIQQEGCKEVEEESEASRNLIVRAYQALLPYHPPAAEVHLYKRIPVAAGLAGGSSNGVLTLRALAPHCGEPPSREALSALALSLGSDCPFFLHQTAMYGRGRGEILTFVENPVRGYYVVIVKPEVSISTAWAFNQLGASVLPSHSLLNALKRPHTQWMEHITNSFQPLVVAHHPIVQELVEGLITAGAFYAALSGSGPTVYGIFKQAPVLQSFRARFPNVFCSVSRFSL